jgi:hypothetical protein
MLSPFLFNIRCCTNSEEPLQLDHLVKDADDWNKKQGSSAKQLSV